MNMRRHTRKGSVTVEAAIILPLFIIAAVTVSYCINIAAATDSVITAVCDRSRIEAAKLYNMPVTSSFPDAVEKRVEEDSIFVDTFDVISVRNIDSTVYLNSRFTVKNRMAVRLRDDFTLECNVKFRGFTGKDNENDLFTFDEMERDDGSSIVWVFPVSGERYHKEDCPYIDVAARQTVLSSEIRAKYSPCRLCRPGELSDGQIVYCFVSSGKAYHRGDCTTVDRYVVSMTVRQAEEEGYSPCSKCGGM